MTIDQNLTPTEPGQQTAAIDREKFRRARQRVAEVKGLYIHFAVFVAVIAGLTIVNIATKDDWWVQWVILGWGIGVLAHALGVYGSTPGFVTRWEKRKLRSYLNAD